MKLWFLGFMSGLYGAVAPGVLMFRLHLTDAGPCECGPIGGLTYTILYFLSRWTHLLSIATTCSVQPSKEGTISSPTFDATLPLLILAGNTIYLQSPGFKCSCVWALSPKAIIAQAAPLEGGSVQSTDDSIWLSKLRLRSMKKSGTVNKLHAWSMG